MLLAVLFHHLLNILSKTHCTLDNSIIIGHCRTNIYRNTLIKTITHITTNHSLLNKEANVKSSILTEKYNT